MTFPLRGGYRYALELTVLRLSWTFNFDYRHYVLAGVIWMIGWSMIALAGVTRLSIRAVGIFGVVMIALHKTCCKSVMLRFGITELGE
jgi:uncharacterized membrane protein